MEHPKSNEWVNYKIGSHWGINYEKHINDILKSNNSWDIAEWFDRKFIKLQVFIEYLLKNNNGKLDHDMQLAIFNDVCKFINKIGENHEFANIFDTFPRTPIDKYHEETVWEQFSQLSGLKRWSEDNMPDWWSCHYRTLLLYNFFNQLKEIWLKDLKIKFFRFKKPIKEKNDKSNKNLYEMKHSWLIITFQWEDYLVDQSVWKNIISNVQNILEELNEEYIKYLNILSNSKSNNNDELKIRIARTEAKINFYKKNFLNVRVKETDNYLYFDILEDFIANLDKHPANKKMNFYLKLGNEKNILSHISFSFVEWWIFITIDNKRYTFKLDVDKIGVKFDGNWYTIHYGNVPLWDSPEEICEKLNLVIENCKERPINQEDKWLLKRVLPFIFKRTDIHIIDFFPDSKEYIFNVQERAKIRNRCYHMPYNELKDWGKPTCYHFE